MSEAESIPAPRTRRWFAFSLRTMLVVVALFSLPNGWIGSELANARSRIRERERIEATGGETSRMGEAMHVWSDWQEKLHKWTGDYELTGIRLSDDADAAEIRRVGGLFPESVIRNKSGKIVYWANRHYSNPDD